jgi:Flp pilus assembly protein TadD
MARLKPIRRTLRAGFRESMCMRDQSQVARFLLSAASVVILAAAVAGCQTTTARGPDVTGSVGGPLAARAEIPRDGDARVPTDALGERYRANPRDPDAAIRYGQALRTNGQRAQAVAVLEAASLVNPNNKAVLAAYGRALADNGNFKQAFDTLSNAHTPANPDWRILSVQGTTLDQMGKHDEARRYYASALKIVPEEPSVLSNLGLSYMLTKDLGKAEQVLRRAYGSAGSDPRIRQNLALVVGLQGRFAEAEAIVKADLPPDEAAANVAYLKQMLSRGDAPRQGAENGAANGVNLSRRS